MFRRRPCFPGTGAKGVIRSPGAAALKRLSLRRGFFCLIPAIFSIALALASCRSAPVPEETPLPNDVPVVVKPAAQSGGGGVVDEIRTYTERGTPSSLLRTLDIIRSRDLASTDFGRAMVYVNITLLKTLYPAVQTQLPHSDPPVTHSYSRILKDAEKGNYTAPHQNSTDYLEYVLPFLAYYTNIGGRVVQAEQYLSTLPDLEKAARMNVDSVLAPFFIGVVYEQTGRPEEASAKYSQVWDLFPECYPAALGLARVMEGRGRAEEATRFLSDLVLRFPDNFQVKRQLALSYYRSGDWSRAEAAVAEILQRDTRDGEFVLMRAHILVEQGQFLQAQAPLDIYATINPTNRLYLFLRARVQAEGYQNRDAALNYLRSIMRSSAAGGGSASGGGFAAGGGSDEAAVYAAKLLMESSRTEDQAEGRELLRRLLAVSVPPLEVIALALDDVINREAWREGRPYITRLLEERRSSRDLFAAYTLEKGQGNNAAALSFARELYERDRTNEDGAFAYISALIDTGRQNEAASMIESRLNGMGGGVLKSRYYFLRSRTRLNEESAMNDLRSSLFEDPRNLNALIAMFEIYHRRRDERRAVYYLKQALALAPDNPRLKRYEAEYAAVLGIGY